MPTDRRTSRVWKVFTRKANCMATCSGCNLDYSYKSSISNLMKHWLKKHSDARGHHDTSDEEYETNDESATSTEYKKSNVSSPEPLESSFPTSQTRVRINKSWVWRHFTRRGEVTATCNACHGEFLFRGGITNLKNHWYRKHGGHNKATVNSDDEFEFLPKKHTPAMRKYFRPTDREGVVQCRVCDCAVPSTTEELTRHLHENHDDDISDQEQAADQKNYNDDSEKDMKSLWTYFKWDGKSQMATCLVCKRLVSYRNSNYYLKRHMKIKHPGIKIEPDDDPKTIIISANGQLYEVETEPGQKDDDQTDPMDMDTVYLDDYEDLIKDMKPASKTLPNSLKRQAKLQPAYKTKRKTFKRKIDRESRSDDEETKQSSEKGDSLDFFGKYLISLLKDLPKHISDQLQSKMIKLALDAKITHQAQHDFKITVLNSVDSSVPVAVTVTESEAVSDGTAIVLQEGSVGQEGVS